MKRKRRERQPYPIEVDGKSLPSIGAWAKGAGLSPSAVSKILAGKREPKMGTLERMASTLGVSVPRLWQWLQHEA